jgi:hypothetical protein
MLVARPFQSGAVEQAHPLQRSIGNQVSLRLMAQRDSRLTGTKAGDDPEREVAALKSAEAQEAHRSASWDFSKIPISPPDRSNESQTPSTLPARMMPAIIQRKLVVGEVTDPLEHEADRVADQVMPMSGSCHPIAAAPPQLSRKCAACEENEGELQKKAAAELASQDSTLAAQRFGGHDERASDPSSLTVRGATLASTCESGKFPIFPPDQVNQSPFGAFPLSGVKQPKPVAGRTNEPTIDVRSTQASGVSTPIESAIQTLPGRGQPLPAEVRSFMEPRFAQDFGAVRVHTDAGAHQLAHAVSAQAFTVGQDIVFGAGNYMPETNRGKHLIAHELTHVLQQSHAPTQQTTQIHRQQDADAGAQEPRDANAPAEEGQNPEEEIETSSQGPRPSDTGPAVDTGQNLDQTTGALPTAATATPGITLETGNTGAGPINNAVHQQICVDVANQNGKQCFSFAKIEGAGGVQLPQFSSSWLGWSSTVVGAILKGEVYHPGPVPGATVVSRHTPTAAQAANWLRYMRGTRLGLQDGYSVGRHNCRTFSQWEFRDAPSKW